MAGTHPARQKVSPNEAVQLINRAKTTILDVRDGKEYADGHLPDAKHIPAGELKQRVSELDKFKNRTIVVACQRRTRFRRGKDPGRGWIRQRGRPRGRPGRLADRRLANCQIID